MPDAASFYRLLFTLREIDVILKGAKVYVLVPGFLWCRLDKEGRSYVFFKNICVI